MGSSSIAAYRLRPRLEPRLAVGTYGRSASRRYRAEAGRVRRTGSGRAGWARPAITREDVGPWRGVCRDRRLINRVRSRSGGLLGQGRRRGQQQVRRGRQAPQLGEAKRILVMGLSLRSRIAQHDHGRGVTWSADPPGGENCPGAKIAELSGEGEHHQRMQIHDAQPFRIGAARSGAPLDEGSCFSSYWKSCVIWRSAIDNPGGGRGRGI